MDMDRITSALAELEKISAGYVPTDEDLSGAPLLNSWTVTAGPTLTGEVSGHPVLGDRVVTTSVVLAIDPVAGWARTVSRYYRLGRQHGQKSDA